MKEHKKGNTYYQSFATYHEYLKDLETLPERQNFRSSSKEISDDRTRFTGTESLEAAIELARFGWKEGREQFVSGLALATERADYAMMPAKGYRMVGSHVDVPRYLTGIPTHMIGKGESQNSVTPIIKLVITGGAAASIKHNQIMNRGIAIASAVDKLETEGFECEIELAFCNECNDHKNYTSIPLKKAGEPLNLDVLAFNVAHPSSLRRLNFRTREMSQLAADGHLDSTFGFSVSRPLEDGEIGFPAIRYREGGDWGTLENAIKRVQKIINEGLDRLNHDWSAIK